MPTPTYELIASATGNGSADVITLSGIPATYTDLVMVIKVKNASAGLMGNRLRFNGDTTDGNYSGVRVSAGGGSLADERDTSGLYPVNSQNTEFSVGVINIMNYSSTVIRKSTISLTGYAISGADFVRMHTGVWRDTSAITSVTLFNDSSSAWSNNSTIALYGIKAS